MARLVICQGCREKFDRDTKPFTKISKGYYHEKCYNDMMLERGRRESILDYLGKLSKRTNYPLVQKQIKEFTEKYGYTESGILGTLHFMIEVKKMALKPETGIAFVPYLYNDARKYYERLNKLSDIEVFDSKDIEVIVTEKKTNKNKKLIDIDKMF